MQKGPDTGTFFVMFAKKMSLPISTPLEDKVFVNWSVVMKS